MATLEKRYSLPADGYIQVVPKGEFKHHSGYTQVCDDIALENQAKSLRDSGKPFPLHIDHYEDLTKDQRAVIEKTGLQLPSAAIAWCDSPQVRADGLYAKPTFIANGREMIESGQYRLISPTFPMRGCEMLDVATKRIRPNVLKNASVTNDPVMKTIAMLCNGESEFLMNKDGDGVMFGESVDLANGGPGSGRYPAGSGGNNVEPHAVGTKVRTDSGEIGEINFVHRNDPGYPHAYKVTDLRAKDPSKQTRLEGGRFISHERLTPISDSEVDTALKNSGTTEGAEKGWETRRGGATEVEHEGKKYHFNNESGKWHDRNGEPVGNSGIRAALESKSSSSNAVDASIKAYALSDVANKSGSESDHEAAGNAHMAAAKMHTPAGQDLHDYKAMSNKSWNHHGNAGAHWRAASEARISRQPQKIEIKSLASGIKNRAPDVNFPPKGRNMKNFIALLKNSGVTIADDATAETVEAAFATVLTELPTLKNRVNEIDAKIGAARRSFILDSFTPAVIANREQAEALLTKDEAAFIGFCALTKDGAEIANSIKTNLENGDYAGHPFHGNQYTDGTGSGDADKDASRNADERSKATKGLKSGTAEHSKAHTAAATAHEHASKRAREAGNDEKADYHDAMAKFHSKRVGGPASAGENTDAAKNAKMNNREYQRPEHKFMANREDAKLPARGSGAVVADDASAKEEMAGKEKIVRDIQNRDKCEWGEAMSKAYKEHPETFVAP